MGSRPRQCYFLVPRFPKCQEPHLLNETLNSSTSRDTYWHGTHILFLFCTFFTLLLFRRILAIGASWGSSYRFAPYSCIKTESETPQRLKYVLLIYFFFLCLCSEK